MVNICIKIKIILKNPTLKNSLLNKDRNQYLYLTNLYCEENSKCQGQDLFTQRSFCTIRIPKRFLVLGKQNWQTQISDRRKQLWEDDISKPKERQMLCFFYLSCKNIPHFTGLAYWEQIEGSIAGKVVWSPEKVYNKGHRYSLEALQLSKRLQTCHQNFSMHFSGGHLGQERSGIEKMNCFLLPSWTVELPALWGRSSWRGYGRCSLWDCKRYLRPVLNHGHCTGCRSEWPACDVELRRKRFGLGWHSRCNKPSSLGPRL